MKHYLVAASAVGIAASAFATVSSTLVADRYIVKDGAGASAKFYSVLDIYVQGNHLGDIFSSVTGLNGTAGHDVVFATSQAQGVTRDATTGKVNGGTITSEGLAWGWRTLSPNWRGLWGGATPNTLPKDYHTPLIDKVVVILTDGMNELYRDTSRTSDSDYTAYGRLSAGRLGTTTSLTTARQTINSKTLQICSAMKAQGIIIYTITFEVDNSTAGQEGKTLFRNCATSPAHYFDNPVGADLTTTFRQIATEIGNLRIAQ